MRPRLLCLLALTIWAGCVHTPAPDPGADLPPDAPAVAEILADLSRPDRSITNFSSLGTIRMQLPGQAARQRFTRSYINFQPPARFYARAMKATQAVNIHVDETTFLLDHQAERVFYFGHEGDRFDDVALDVAPSIIFREFFLADYLSELRENQVAMLRYSPEDGRAVLGIFTASRRQRLAHQLIVGNGPEGWRVVQSDLMGPDGHLLAATRYADYAVVDGVFMPRLIETKLPQSGGLLSFEIQSNAQANRQNPAPIADLSAVRESLLAAGYREVTGTPSEGTRP